MAGILSIMVWLWFGIDSFTNGTISVMAVCQGAVASGATGQVWHGLCQVYGTGHANYRVKESLPFRVLTRLFMRARVGLLWGMLCLWITVSTWDLRIFSRGLPAERSGTGAAAAWNAPPKLNTPLISLGQAVSTKL